MIIKIRVENTVFEVGKDGVTDIYVLDLLIAKNQYVRQLQVVKDSGELYNVKMSHPYLEVWHQPKYVAHIPNTPITKNQ